MDRAISESTKNKRIGRSLGLGLIIVLFLALGTWLLRTTLSNKISSKRIQTSLAEIGPIENTLTASGEVIPAFEQVVTSSISAQIEEVLENVGAAVTPGTPILRLDKSFSLLEYEKLKQERELKENGILKLKLELEKNFFDLQITDSTKALKINQLEAELENAKRLNSVGGGTQEAIDLAGLNLKIAQLEKRQLEHDLSIQQQKTQTSLKELEIQSQIQLNDLKKMEEKLKRAEVVSKRSGVLTWVNENLGTTVNEGETLARIADLGTYKVKGSCSDIYSDRLVVGMSVLVQINEAVRIPGTISNIHPTVQNSIINFDIQMEEASHAALRPNMKVEVYIVTASKPKVVRVANGPTFKAGGISNVFVVQGNIATRRKVKIGLSNFDFVEIEDSAIKAGEEVIISDMSRYENLSKIIIK